jgi:hypothetical protein
MFCCKKRNNNNNDEEMPKITMMQATGSVVTHFVSDCPAAKQVGIGRQNEKVSCSKCVRLYEKLVLDYVNGKVQAALEEQQE